MLDRKHLDNVQRELRETPGTTVIVFIQTCATEKRKQRKRGTAAAADRHVFINPSVCEGCGDCSTASNCMSIQPIEIEFGRKRRIDQSSCNTDMSCLDGYCPSFVTIEGGRRRTPALIDVEALAAGLVPARPAALDRPYGVLFAGIAGVVTTSAILGMAAHLDGCGVSIYDVTGLAQKGGAVSTSTFGSIPRPVGSRRSGRH